VSCHHRTISYKHTRSISLIFWTNYVIIEVWFILLFYIWYILQNTLKYATHVKYTTNFFFSPGATQTIVSVYFTALSRTLASSRTRLLDHTQRRVTVGRTPLNEWTIRTTKYYNILEADPGGRAVVGLDLRPLACWDCGFKSWQGHGYICSECCADHSSRRFALITVCLNVVMESGEWDRFRRCRSTKRKTYKALHFV
jgi:hypothetical protein